MKRLSLHNREILYGFLFSFSFLFGAKLIGAAKEIVIANYYGVSPAVGAYSLSYAISNWPISLAAMCSNMLLIPAFVASRQYSTGDFPSARRILSVTCVLGIILGVIVWITLQLVSIFSASPEISSNIATASLAFGLSLPPSLMATIVSARLIAQHRQISALLEAVPALIICVFVYFLHSDIAPISILAWATALGVVIYFMALLALDKSVASKHATDVKFESLSAKPYIIGILAQAVFSIGGVLFDQVAAVFLQEDQNAILSYTNRLLMLATGLGATAIGRAFLPVLSSAHTQGSTDKLLYRWLSILMFASLIVTTIGWIFSPAIVKLVFERGSFTVNDSRSVSELFRLGLLQLPFYFTSMILAQSFVVRRKFGVLLLTNALSVAVKFLVSILLFEDLGARALMYGTCAMYAAALISFSANHFRTLHTHENRHTY